MNGASDHSDLQSQKTETKLTGGVNPFKFRKGTWRWRGSIPFCLRGKARGRDRAQRQGASHKCVWRFASWHCIVYANKACVTPIFGTNNTFSMLRWSLLMHTIKGAFPLGGRKIAIIICARALLLVLKQNKTFWLSRGPLKGGGTGW